MDIKFGEGVKEFGGFVVVGMECYELCWIDNQF